MSEVTVIAHVQARPGHEQRVQKELEKMVAPTRAEAGCIRYELHRDMKDPANFMFNETWDSVESHQTHMDSEHLAAFVLACKGAIAEATIQHFERVA